MYVLTVLAVSRMNAIVQSQRNVIYRWRSAVEASMEPLYVSMYVCMYEHIKLVPTSNAFAMRCVYIGTTS